MKQILLVLTLVLLAACSSSTETVTINSSLTGTVKLYNADHSTYFANASGVSVSMLGTPFHTVTDSAGNWTLTGMGPGKYSISFVKVGFDTLVLESYPFSGAGVTFVNDVTLFYAAKPIVTLNTPTVTPHDLTGLDSNLLITGTNSEGQMTLLLRVNTSNDPDESTWKRVETGVTWQGNNFRFAQPSQNVRHMFGNVPNNTYYFRVYATPSHGVPAVSNTVSVLIPPPTFTLNPAQITAQLQSIRDTNVFFSGTFSDGVTPIIIKGSTSNDPNDATWKEIVRPSSWSGTTYRAGTTIETIRGLLRVDSLAEPVYYFRAYTFENTPDHSNTLTQVIPRDSIFIDGAQTLAGFPDSLLVTGHLTSIYEGELRVFTRAIGTSQWHWVSDEPLINSKQFTMLLSVPEVRHGAFGDFQTKGLVELRLTAGSDIVSSDPVTVNLQ